MPTNPAYDLFVLLDLEFPDERRAQLVEQIRTQLQNGGSLKGDVDWGTRKLAYEIDHRGEAQYHLFQFESAPEFLRELDRSLSIDDAVLRHRIIRLPGAAPDAPPPKPSAEEFRREERPERGDRGDRGRGGRGPRGGSDRGESRREEPAAAPPEEAAPTPDAPAAEQPAPVQDAVPEPAEQAAPANGESSEPS
jgi:small subunit ribosomal protein S6